MRIWQPEWRMDAGYGLDGSGRAVKRKETAATLRFYHAGAGDRLRLLDRHYEYAVAVYGGGSDPKYIYTYDYEPEENWTSCLRLHPEAGFTGEDTVFGEDVYFRVMLRKKTHGPEGCVGCQEPEGWPELKEILELIRCGTGRGGQADADNESRQGKEPGYGQEPGHGKESEHGQAPGQEFDREFGHGFELEIEETARTVQKYRGEMAKAGGSDPLVFFLLTDTHYAVGGTWEDTVRTMGAVNGAVRAAGCIHLGDATDGLVPAEIRE